MRDAHSEALLLELHPKVRPDFKSFLEEVEQEYGVTVRIIQAARTWKQMHDNYAIGRTVKGENVSIDHPMGDIVTNAPPGASYHFYRLAVDAAPLKANGEVDYNYDQSKWANLAAQYNITWGGNFPGNFKDPDHWENKLGYNWRDLLAMYNAGKFIPGTQFLDI
jgi:peptidoglycan L-alanyl-D-glutamate endopeptidase CwlK